jgi:hypothetical protein
MIIGGYKKGDISASTEVGWLALNVPVLINDGVWATKTLTSGRQDAYILSWGFMVYGEYPRDIPEV